MSSTVEKLKKLKQLLADGYMTQEEYDERRIQLINQSTKTKYNKQTEIQKEEPKPEIIFEDEMEEKKEEEETVTIVVNGKKWVQPKMKPEVEKMIFRAVIGRKVDTLRDLHESGATFNIIDRHGNTPLHYACEIGMRQIVQFLVERGAKINVKNRDRKTPLHILVEKRWADLAKWLLYQGANPNLKDKNLKTPIYYAHPWLAGEMKEILLQRERAKKVAEGSVVVTHTNDYGQQPSILNIKAGSGKTDVDTVMKSTVTRDKFVEEFEDVPIYLRNGTSKKVNISNGWNAERVTKEACKAFRMEEIEQHMRLAVRTGLVDKNGVKQADRYLDPSLNVDSVRYNEWPDPNAYKLILLPVQGCPVSVSMRFRELMYGTDKTDWSKVEIKAPPKKEVKGKGFFFRKVAAIEKDDKKKRDEKQKNKKSRKKNSKKDKKTKNNKKDKKNK